MNVKDKARPWFKFWSQDWLADPDLKRCSASEHGMLINLMAIAHGCEPYGELRRSDGTPMTDHDIRITLSWNYQTVRMTLSGLLHNARIGMGKDGAYFIPRMVKDGENYRKQRDYGYKGGNPTLKAPLKAPLKVEAEAEAEVEVETDPPTPRRGKSVFVKPSLSQIREYANSANLGNVDPNEFLDHFDSNGWRISGKAPMKDWQAAARNWNRRNKNGGFRKQEPISTSTWDSEKAKEKGRAVMLEWHRKEKIVQAEKQKREELNDPAS